MAPLLLVVALLTLAPVPASALQNEDAVQAAEEGSKPAPTVRSSDGQRVAVPREAHPRAAAPPPAAPAVVSAPQAQPVAAEQRTDGSRDRGDDPEVGGAVQRGDRPRGDNPPVGQAIPRDARPAPAPPRPGEVPRHGSGNIYVAPPVYNYYYSPRRYYPYGYGAFGLGYFYYDPYVWYPPSYYGNYYGSYYGGYYDSFYGGYYDNFYSVFDVGELRLAVSPRFADVYVDGYFAGRVDDYDGAFQALKLRAGAHHIQIVAPGFAPLDFDVRIDPGRKITYRGVLQPLRP